MFFKERFAFILFLIFLAGFSLRPGITSIAPLLGDIQLQFAANDTTLGLLTSIPVICMGLLSPLAHHLSIRMGMKSTLVFGFSLVALGELLRFQTSWVFVLLITALLVGIGDALIRPVLSGFIKQHSSQRSSVAIGWYAASMGIGSACAAIFSTPISAALGGFEFGLAFWSLPTLFCIAAFIFGIKATERRKVNIASASGTSVGRTLIILLILLFALQSGLNYAISAWLPQWLLAQQKSQLVANQYTFLFIITSTATSLLYPLFVRLLNNNAVYTVLLASLYLIFSAVCYLIHWPLLLSVIFISVSIGILFPLLLEMPLFLAKTPTEAIHISGIIQAFGYVLGGTTPVIIGFATSHYGITTALINTVAAMILAIFITGIVLIKAITHYRY